MIITLKYYLKIILTKNENKNKKTVEMQKMWI